MRNSGNSFLKAMPMSRYAFAHSSESYADKTLTLSFHLEVMPGVSLYPSTHPWKSHREISLFPSTLFSRKLCRQCLYTLIPFESYAEKFPFTLSQTSV